MFTFKAELNKWPRSNPVQLSPGAGMDGRGKGPVVASPLLPFQLPPTPPTPLCRDRTGSLSHSSAGGGRSWAILFHQFLPFPAPVVKLTWGPCGQHPSQLWHFLSSVPDCTRHATGHACCCPQLPPPPDICATECREVRLRV